MAGGIRAPRLGIKAANSLELIVEVLYATRPSEPELRGIVPMATGGSKHGTVTQEAV